jgi:hypothetical protein
MAITVLLEIPGMDQAKYEKLIQKLQATGAAPEGRSFHIASGKEGGMLAVDVWESPEKLQAFAGKLMPLLQELGVTPKEPQVLPTFFAVAG